MLNDDEISDFIRQNTPKNTLRKTDSDLRIFDRWLKENLPSETRKMEEIEPSQLNQILRTFFIKVRKNDGTSYEPDSIKAIQNSLDRYLSEKNYCTSILRGIEFKGSREVMTAKRKELKHEGLGRKPNRAKPIVDDEEEILWSSGQLGAHNPVSLQNAIWWRNNFFGIRGRQEHRDMRWGDVLIQTDADGQQYLEYLERDTKTRKDPRQERPFNTRIYAIPEAPERCPVNLLIAFTHKRPLTMLQPDSPFYLSVLPQKQMKPDIWYKDCALGVHSLGDIMKNMSEKAGLKKHTNHSGRKTTVKRLREAGIESSDIIQLTGHKTIQSVNNYSDVSVKKQKQMSKILVTGAAISQDRRLVSRPVSRPPVEPTTMRSTTVPVATVTTAASPAANSLENTDLYDFDPNDNFEEIVAEIEKFESNTTQKLNTCIQKSLIPQGSFNNCTFNFSVNFAK